MSRISELILKLCPGGVRFSRLGDLVRIRNGKDHKQLGDGDIPVYGSGGVMRYADTAAYDKPSVLIPRKGSLGNLFYVDVPFWTVDTIFYTEINESLIVPKFLYYFLATVGLGEMNQAGGVPSQTQSVLNELKIPVPPVEVQREIVRVLDSFSALEAELESELEARRVQRTAVINNEFVALGGTQRLAIGDLATQSVKPITVEPDVEYVNLGVKWYGEGAFAREPKRGSAIKGKTLYKVRAGQFIYNRMFVTEGSFGLVTPEIEHGVVSKEFPVFDLDTNRVIPEWLYLKFRDPQVVSVAAGQASGGTKSRRRWMEDQFRAFVIDLPPLAVQHEMVRVHNRFIELESGIDEELAARRKQYEYYRDKLLTFEELPA